jgi:hypothetical protein
MRFAQFNDRITFAKTHSSYECANLGRSTRYFRSQLGIDVDQYSVRRLSLAGMTGYGIAMIEMGMQARIELHLVALTEQWKNRPDRQASSCEVLHESHFCDTGKLRALERTQLSATVPSGDGVGSKPEFHGS